MPPKTPQEYLSKTEHAVRHLYDGIASCWAVCESAMKCWNISRLGVPFTEDERERVEKYLELAKKYFDLKFSEATFCGSILQIAVVAIRLFSENESIPMDGMKNKRRYFQIPFPYPKSVFARLGTCTFHLLFPQK